MSKEKDDSLPELTESEKYEVEQEMLDRAFNNSYLILTKKITFEELMDRKSKFGMKAIMIYDPSEEPDEDLFDDIIDHYEYLEDYKRCAELLSIKQKTFENV